MDDRKGILVRSYAKIVGFVFLSLTMILTKAEAAIAKEETFIENVDDAIKFQKNKIKARIGGLWPQGSLTREIYGNVWPEVSLEYNYQYRQHLSFFINGAYFRKSGHSTRGAYKTTMTLFPITMGVNVRFGNSSCWHPYLGFGVGSAYFHFHNFSPYVKKHGSYFGFASIIQTGVEFNITKYFFLDLFASYRYNWFNFNKNISKSLTGGVDLGVGLGVVF